MSKIEIYGESDDIITIDGDYDDEVEAIDGRYLLFADGTVVSGEFTEQGVWRFKVEKQGQATALHEPAEEFEDLGSDMVTLEYPGDLSLLWDGSEMPPDAPLEDLLRAAKIRFDLIEACHFEDKDENALAVILKALQDK
ncbi:MAG TPA: hypothetical protein PKV97_00095 [Thauera aminoaromatica]|nr:hypothetical protein [Thauera aminoaromatica]